MLRFDLFSTGKCLAPGSNRFFVSTARLVRADRARAIKFFESFFSSCSDVLRTDTGVLLVEHTMSWLPDKLIDEIIDEWISGDWQLGPQAAGEILALKLCRNPEDMITQKQVEQILSTNKYAPSVLDGLRVGVSYTLIAVWSTPALRARSTKYLVQLVEMGSDAVQKALIIGVRNLDSLLPDDHTKDFLEVLLEHSKNLIGIEHFLIQELKELLRDGWRPYLVYKVMRLLVSKKAGHLKIAGEVADIALTLHRIPETFEPGLELFESLIEVRAFGIDQRISKLDRIAFK